MTRKTFKKENLHSMSWIYSEQEIVCTRKYTLFSSLGIMGEIEVEQ